MLKKMQKLQEYLNGSEAEKFLGFYYGKYFTGSMTFIEDGKAGTLYFRKGRVYDVEEGIPEGGIDIGVSGSSEQWDGYANIRRSLTISTTDNGLGLGTGWAVLGDKIRVRQNFSPLAQAARLYSYVREGMVPGADVPKRDPDKPVSDGPITSIRGFYIRINGIKIYVETNDAPDDKATIICCHTAGRENRQYHDLMEIFKDKYRMYAFDMPGHGKSWPLPGNSVNSTYTEYGNWIWDVTQALGVKDPIIIGCSMGGGITYHMAQNYPVRAIVCMQGADNTKFEIAGGVIELLFHPYVSCQHSHMELTESLIGTRTSQERVDFIHWGVLTEIGKTKQADTIETSSLDVSDKMHKVTCPVLIIEGIEDQSYTPEMAKGSLSRLVNCKNKTLKLIEGYGHFIIVENPELVGQYIDEFIQTL